MRSNEEISRDLSGMNKVCAHRDFGCTHPACRCPRPPKGPSVKATDEEVLVWGERHGLRASFTDLRCAFEDAQTFRPAGAPAVHPPGCTCEAYACRFAREDATRGVSMPVVRVGNFNIPAPVPRTPGVNPCDGPKA